MRVEELRVFNYRSIRNQQTVPLRDGAVLVGPNNVGKSNLLRAVELFFRAARDNTYDVALDRPHRESGRTSMRAVFSFDPDDEELWLEYQELHKFVDEESPTERQVPIYLEFSRAGNAFYKLFPNSKPDRPRQSDFSRRQQQFVHQVLDRFSVRYVPSAKDWDAFYSSFLVPALGAVIEVELADQLDGVRRALSEIGTEIGQSLDRTLQERLTIELRLPQTMSQMLGSVEISLRDPTPTDLAGKGQGIQSAFLLAAIGWISRTDKKNGKLPIWLLEEPEAYMHPALASSIVRLVDDARDHGPIVYTTHSLSLVPSDVTRVRGVEKPSEGATTLRSFSNHAQATESIRAALGVKAADYFGYSAGVVFLEGASDRELIEWYLGERADAHELLELRAVSLAEFGGVKNLSGFIAGTFPILRNEVPVVAVFDGDDAGVREVKALGSRFGNAGTPWEANLDCILLPSRKTIEGLFPDGYILEMAEQHSAWFGEQPVIDMAGVVNGFRIRDRSKAAARRWLIERVEDGEELPEFRRLMVRLNEALRAHRRRLAG